MNNKKKIIQAVVLSKNEYDMMIKELKKGTEYKIIGKDNLSEICELRNGLPFEKNTNKPIHSTELLENDMKNTKVLSQWGMITLLGGEVVAQENHIRKIKMPNGQIFLFDMDRDKVISAKTSLEYKSEI